MISYMKHEPSSITSQELVQLLDSSYGLKVENIVFSPVGEGAWSYIATDASGMKYWVKLIKGDFYRPLVEVPLFLKEHYQFECAPVLRSRKGDSAVALKEYTVIVYEFLEGEIVGDRSLSAEQWEEIGQLLGTLHNSTLPDSLGSTLRREDFARFQENAARVVAFAKSEKHIGKTQRQLAELIQGKLDEIAAILTRIKELAKAAEKLNTPYVICHTDAHVWNIFLTTEGKFVLLDWDTVMYAPAERDLMFFTGKEQNDFLRGYRKIKPDVQANEMIIIYYKYEWVVQEISDYGERVFFEEINEEAKEHALEKFRELFYPGNVIEQAYGADRSSRDN